MLANYLDALVIRTNDAMEEMRQFASQDRMAVVNAMSANEHPTQSLADLATLRERFGRLEGLHVLYIGEGNNSASAIALAIARLPGMRLTLVTPEGYGLSGRFHRRGSDDRRCERLADRAAPRHGPAPPAGRGRGLHHPLADHGGPAGRRRWLPKFRPYTVTPKVMAEVSKTDGSTVFLHDLPAMRGYEVLDEVLDGPQSIALRQATTR